MLPKKPASVSPGRSGAKQRSPPSVGRKRGKAAVGPGAVGKALKVPPTPTRAPAKGNIASYWPQRPPGPVATSPGRHSPGEASPPGLRQRWEADCPPPLRSVRVSVPPALSQSTDTASQAGFALLSQQSQDWLTGSGVTATAPPRDVSPPPLTHTKKRKPADDIMSNVLATKLRNFNVNSPLTRSGSVAAANGTTVLAGVSVNKFWRGHTTQEQNVRFDEFNKQRTRERHVVPCAVTSRYLLDFVEVAEVGSGSFCEVAQAKHRLDGCTYAIKRYKQSLCQEAQRRQALSEVHALSALCDCRTIIRYFGSWFEGDVLYVQTEMCWGSVEALVTSAAASVSTVSQCMEKEWPRPRPAAAPPAGSITGQKVLFGSHRPLLPPRVDSDDEEEGFGRALRYDRPRVGAPLAGPVPSQDVTEEEAPATPVHEPPSLAPASPVPAPLLATPVYATPEVCGTPDFCFGSPAAPAAAPSRRHRLSEDLVKQLIADIAEALHEMHSRNIVHLDVKPANILLDVEGKYCGQVNVNEDGDVTLPGELRPVAVRFKLGDLGLACSVFEARPEGGDGRYLCHHLMNDRFTSDTLPASDIYALGASVFEIASGTSLQYNEPAQSMLRAGDVSTIPGLSPPLMALLRMMVRAEPRDRITASQILAHPALADVDCIPVKFRSLTRCPSSVPSVPTYAQLMDQVEALKRQLCESTYQCATLERNLSQGFGLDDSM